MREKNTILMVGPVPPQIGGIEFFLEALLHSKLSEWWRIRHFDISKPKSRKKEQFQSPMGYARSFNRRLSTTLLSFGYSFFYFAKYLVIIFFSRPALVHLHSSSYMSFWEKCLYLDVAKLCRKKVILHIHGSSFDRFIQDSYGLLRRLILWHLHRCDCVIALSHAWKEFFIPFIPREKIVIVENGIDVALFSETSEPKTPYPSVVFLGEVCRRKGIYDLIPAIAEAARQVADLTCFVVGPGELDKAKHLAQSCDLNGRVQFIGPRHGDDKRRWLAKSWLLVLPSYAEVLPIVILEAFASGLPVISTTVGGIPDLVTNGSNGLLVTPGDQQALTDAVRLLCVDDRLRRTMGESNRRLAREKYDINVCAEKISAIYDRLLID